MKIPRGRGFQKPNFLNESMALKGNFCRGWGGGFNLKNLPWEGYGYLLEQHNVYIRQPQAQGFSFTGVS